MKMRAPVVLALALAMVLLPLPLTALVTGNAPDHELPWFLTDMRPPLNPPSGWVMPSTRSCGGGHHTHTEFPDYSTQEITVEQLQDTGGQISGRTVYPIKFNFSLIVSFEWDATPSEFTDMEGGLKLFAQQLLDMTDGQFFVNKFDIYKSQGQWNNADIRVLNIPNYRANAMLGGISYGGWINIGRDAWGGPWNSGLGAIIIAHEFGHYGLYLPDEYDDATGTHCDNGAANTCIMSNPYNEFELCTAESHNAAGTGDPRACWGYIKYYYSATTEVHNNPDPGPTTGPPATVTWHYPDLNVVPSEMNVFPLTGNEGDNVTITMPVHNVDRLINGAVNVRFYIDTVASDKLIGQSNITVNGQEVQSVNIKLQAPGGVHSIIGVADPDNKFKEYNENNNQAIKQINMNNRPKISSSLGTLVSQEDVPLTIKLTQYATDAEDASASLKWSVVSFNQRLIISVSGQNSADQTLNFYPAANWSGSSPVTVSVTDSKNCAAQKTVTLSFTSVNDLPVPFEPGVAAYTVYRGKSIDIFSNARDVEEAETALVPSFEWKSEFAPDWTPVSAAYEVTRFKATVPVGTNTPVGKADARYAFADSSGGRGEWTYLNASFDILNNRPSVVDLAVSEQSVTRGGFVLLTANATDTETLESGLRLYIQYRSVSGEWTDLETAGGEYKTDTWTYTFDAGAALPTGSYDFRLRVNDSDGGASEWSDFTALLEIKNALPAVESGKISKVKILRGENATLTVSARDFETAAKNLEFEVRCIDPKGREQSTYVKKPEWKSTQWEIRFAPPAGSLAGRYSFEITARDVDGGTSPVYLGVPKLDVGNNLPAAAFNVTGTVNEGDVVWFDGSVSRDPESAQSEMTFAWNFGDGTTGTGSRPSHVFSRSGALKVTLTLTDKDGAVSTADKTITVNARPIVAGLGGPGGTGGLLLIGGMIILIAVAAGVGVAVMRRKKNTRAAPPATKKRPAPAPTPDYGRSELAPAYSQETYTTPAYTPAPETGYSPPPVQPPEAPAPVEEAPPVQENAQPCQPMQNEAYQPYTPQQTQYQQQPVPQYHTQAPVQQSCQQAPAPQYQQPPMKYQTPAPPPATPYVEARPVQRQY